MWGRGKVAPLLRLSGRGAWRSLVSALVWGTRGPEFESRRPDCIEPSALSRWQCAGLVASGANRGRMSIYGYDPAVVFAVAFVAIVLLAAILTARGS